MPFNVRVFCDEHLLVFVGSAYHPNNQTAASRSTNLYIQSFLIKRNKCAAFF